MVVCGFYLRVGRMSWYSKEGIKVLEVCQGGQMTVMEEVMLYIN